MRSGERQEMDRLVLPRGNDVHCHAASCKDHTREREKGELRLFKNYSFSPVLLFDLGGNAV
jgi:hypothetical protein